MPAFVPPHFRKHLISALFISLILTVAITDQTIKADSLTAGTAQQLIDAINAANVNPDPDTITLTDDILLNIINNSGANGANGLPMITTPITINGFGNFLNRNSDSGIPEFRIFYVETTGNLTLNSVLSSDGKAVNGGTIFIHQGAVTLLNESNLFGKATGKGGAIYNDGGIFTVISSGFTGFAPEGAGIYNNAGTVTVTLGYISGGGTNGGGVYNNNGSVTLETTTNIAWVGTNGKGGGAFNKNGKFTINRSLFVANTAEDGGGLYNDGGDVTITNSTFSDDGTIGGEGGNLYNKTGATVTVWYSTFFPAGGFGSSEVYNDGTLNMNYSIVIDFNDVPTCTGSGTYNVQGNLATGQCGTTEVTNLDGIQDNGGPTLTHALLPGSNAINAGNDCSTTPDIVGIDQRGFARDGQCDVGAYEFDGIVPTPTATLDVTLTPTPTVTPIFTPTATTSPEINLLHNEGFEVDNDANNIPDEWTSINATGDRRKCNTPDKTIAFEGECAYRFKGGTGENSKLTQVIDAPEVNVDDILSLDGQVNAKGSVKTAVKVVIKYADSSIPNDKFKVKLTAPTPGYTPLTGTLSTEITGEVASIKVVLQNKGTSGKVYYDALSLVAEPASRLIPLP
ncbi:MAG TPA: choice-of-anchor Q domain-containing protein [Phototrophicaceae bacterium]|jgi:hypothetical protein|nr:choice-of-anchor Q domain-containing protein [Phototrophicaceae bacterium]